jgi:predicted PurR-regulated permease PerM
MLALGLVVLQIIMMIDGNIINPRLLAGSIKVHPLLVVASLLAGGAIGGLLGMLLAVPTGAFIRMQFEKWLAKKEPPEEPEAEPAE